MQMTAQLPFIELISQKKEHKNAEMGEIKLKKTVVLLGVKRR